MKTIFVDTSLLIDFHRTQRGLFLDLLEDSQISKKKLAISVVVFYEFWSGRSMSKYQVLQEAEFLFEPFESYEVSIDIAKKAGEIRRNYGTDGMDAIIAATALENNAQLATLNTKHFENISGLRLWRGKK